MCRSRTVLLSPGRSEMVGRTLEGRPIVCFRRGGHNRGWALGVVVGRGKGKRRGWLKVRLCDSQVPAKAAPELLRKDRLYVDLLREPPLLKEFLLCKTEEERYQETEQRIFGWPVRVIARGEKGVNSDA